MKTVGVREDLLRTAIDAIYDAALHPELWPRVVKHASAYCGSSTGTLVWMDRSKSGSVRRYSTLPSDAASAYQQEWFPADPCQRFYNAHPSATTLIGEQWEPRHRFRASELYRKFLSRVGVEDRAAVAVLREGDRFALFGVGRGRREDPYTLRDLTLLEDLAPHFRQAVRVVQRIQHEATRNSTFSAALDLIEDGAFLLDAQGRVVYTNAAGEDLTARQVLTVRNRRLTAWAPEDASPLTLLVRRTAATSEGEGVDPGGTIPLRDEEGQVRATLSATPLRADPQGSPFGMNPVRVVVFVREARPSKANSADTLRNAFGLTRAEARLAHALAEGQSLQDIADTHGIGKETLRSQLRGVFFKTGVNRQVDLIKVLFSLSGSEPPQGGKLPN